MATHLLLCLLLTFMCSFSRLSAEISRKELKTKTTNQDAIIQLNHPIQSNKFDPSRAIQLSWRPRVFIYEHFLSDEECDHLISLGHGKQENYMSSVNDSGKTSSRPSDFDILVDKEDEITARVGERISAWTFLPKENSKSLKIMHFGPEDDRRNYDFFGDKSTVLSEPIMATVILYLSNVSRGGQILFPDSDMGNSHTKDVISSDCTKSGYSMRSSKGTAILFFNSHLNATPDQSSSHARCPVLEGQMWCATKTFRVNGKRGVNTQLEVENSDCTDEDDSCPKWAAIGECQRNPVFMVGSPDYYGTCRKSCNAC